MVAVLVPLLRLRVKVLKKKLCISHSFSLFPSSWCFWTNWQKLFSNLPPIAGLSVCGQNRSY